MIIYTTTSREEEARKIAKELLHKRIVACANIFPITSIYWWKDNIEESGEIAIIFKTKKDKVDEVFKEIRKLHSYDVPVIQSWNAEMNKEAIEWLDNEVK